MASESNPLDEAFCASTPTGDELRAVFRQQIQEEREKVRMRMAALLNVGACLLVCAGAITLTSALEAARHEPCVAYHDLDSVMQQIEAWNAIHGHYPDSLRELVRKEPGAGSWEPGFEEYPYSYGQEWGYLLIDEQPVLIFYGEDGVPGGTGRNRDWLWPKDRSMARAVRRCGTP